MACKLRTSVRTLSFVEACRFIWSTPRGLFAELSGDGHTSTLCPFCTQLCLLKISLPMAMCDVQEKTVEFAKKNEKDAIQPAKLGNYQEGSSQPVRSGHANCLDVPAGSPAHAPSRPPLGRLEPCLQAKCGIMPPTSNAMDMAFPMPSPGKLRALSDHQTQLFHWKRIQAACSLFAFPLK